MNLNIFKFNDVDNIHHGRDAISMPDPKLIKLIEARTELTENWNWTIIFNDGSKWDIDCCNNERPTIYDEATDNEIVVDDEFRMFLNELPMPDYGDIDDYDLVLDWEIEFKDGRPINTKITNLESND